MRTHNKTKVVSQKASPANRNSGKVGLATIRLNNCRRLMLDHEKFIRKLYTYGEGQG